MEEKILRNILEPVQLKSTKYLQNGSIIQFYPLTNVESAEPQCLSITPSAHKDTHSEDIINERSAVTVAPSVFTCRRNSFKIIDPCDPSGEGVIKYNQDIFIQTCCSKSFTSHIPMVIYSSNRIMENPLMDVDNFYRFYYTKGNLHQPVALCEMNHTSQNRQKYCQLPPVASTYCRWRFEHPDPEYRFEFEGEPIPLSTADPVLILHPATNKYLTIEENRQRLTLIGPETCISVKYRPKASRDVIGMWKLLANSEWLTFSLSLWFHTNNQRLFANIYLQIRLLMLLKSQLK